jgi:transcription initiation factor TFIID subunit 10
MAGAPPEGLVDVLKVLDTANLTVSSARSPPSPLPLASDLFTPFQVPDELTRNLMARSGAVCADERSVRLVSLAAQKFLTDVIEDAKEGAAARSQAPLAVQKTEGFARQQDKDKDRRATLLTEDVARALQKVKEHPKNT